MAGFWQGRPTLVTGGRGLLGSWVVRRLCAGGADVVCLVRDTVRQNRLWTGGLTDRIKCVQGDIRSQDLMERILQEYEVDTVMHLAAQALVGIANSDPVTTLDTNIRGTWAVLEACRRSTSVRQIVLASSDKAYGDQPTLPYQESTPLEGRHPYAVSKSCGDLIAQAYAKTYSLPVAITRCGNFYGGGDLNWSRIVPGTIRSVLHGEPPIIRSDGTYIRDYFYVEDGAAANMLLAERLAADRSLTGLAFNFSNELQITALELVKKILCLMDSTLEPDVRNEASGEILHQYLSAAKAREMLEWAPLFSIEEGLRRTVDWYRGYFEHE